MAGCLKPKCGQMKHEIIFFLHNCSLRGSYGFSVQRMPPGAGLLGAGAFWRGALFPGRESRCGASPLRALWARQERSDQKEITVHGHFVENMPSVLRSLWATPVEDLTCCCSQSGKHWRGCCEGKALVVQIVAIQFCSSCPVSCRFSLVPLTFKDSWFSLCFALLFVFCFFYMTVSVVLAFFF